MPKPQPSLTDTSDLTENNEERSVHLSESVLRPFWTAVYTDKGNEPSDALKDINGGSSDLNSGFGGNFVYLCKRHWTSDRSEALTDFYFHRTSYNDMPKGPNAGWPDYSGDLADGENPYSSHMMRWLSYVQNGRNQNVVRDAALCRMSNASGGSKGNPPDGWKWISADLNQKRGGEYLYIVTR